MTSSSSTSSPSHHQSRPYRFVADVPKGYFAVGKIVGMHGLKGEVKVESYTDFPERFEAGAILLVGSDLEELTLQAARPHKGNLLMVFEEIGDRDEAEAMRGAWLYVPEQEAATLDENAYWVHDILGMDVVTDEGQTLGTIADVLFTGSNEVYVVRRAAAAGEILLPATDEVVRAVDVAGRRMTVHLIPGILE